MRRSIPLLIQGVASAKPNLIQIHNATFYREHPSTIGHDSTASNPPLFEKLNFTLPATLVKDAGVPTRKDEHWAVIAANEGTTFLEILRGLHVCIPPKARSYPYLASKEIAEKDHRLRIPSRAIQYVGFNPGKGQSMGGGIRGAYLSARYESHREESDWTVLQYLKGETELNPSNKEGDQQIDGVLLDQVIRDLKLQKLVDMPVSNLSNGQTRRSRIAKALLGKPELLLLDEPFMGLDPPTLVSLSPMLRELAFRSSPLLLLALRPQDPIPDWITHLAILGHQHTISLMGPKVEVLFALHKWADEYNKLSRTGRSLAFGERMAEQMSKKYGPPLMNVGDTLSVQGIKSFTLYDRVKSDCFGVDGAIIPEFLAAGDQEKWEAAKSRGRQSIQDLLTLTTTLPQELKTKPFEDIDSQTHEHNRQVDAEFSAETQRILGEPLIELNSVVVKYGEKTVLGYPPPQPGYEEPGLNFTVRRGTRLALLGPNGSGKTTLLSLLTSDHPQSYSLPIKFFGRLRLPKPGKPGLSLWEIQSRIGHSAPEVHAFFPKTLSIRQVLESAWAETYSSKPKLTFQRDELIDAFLHWWEPELKQDAPPTHDRRTGQGRGAGEKKTSAIRDLVDQSYPPFILPPSQWGEKDAVVEGQERAHDLSWAEDKNMHYFRVLPFGTQRLLLFLRALIKQPDIVILDEAFSGLSAYVREKAMCWLEHGETMFLQRRLISETDHQGQTTLEKPRWEVKTVPNYRQDVLKIAEKLDLSLTELVRGKPRTKKLVEIYEMSKEELFELSNKADDTADKLTVHREPFRGLTDQQAMVVVSHVKEEIPAVVDEWLRLPGEEEVTESGRCVEMGRCDNGSIRTSEGWHKVWGL